MKLPYTILLMCFAGCFATGCSVQGPQDVVNLDIASDKFTIITPERFLERADLIQLEFNVECGVGDYFFLMNSIDEFFVFDGRYRKKKVYRFNHQGRFINVIGKNGEGPGEYTGVSEVIISDSMVDFLSRKQVYTYGRSGKFIIQKNYLDFGASSFVWDKESGDYFFYIGGGGYRNFIQRIDQLTGNHIDSLLPWYPDDIAAAFQTFSLNPGGKILFYEPHLNKIYELSRDTLIEKYSLDYGDFNRKREEFTWAGGLADILSKAGWWGIVGVKENASYLYLNLVKTDPLNDSGQYFHLIYSKKSKTLYRISDSEKFSANLMTAFAISDKNELWFSAIPANIMDIDPWKTVLEKDKIDPEGNPIIIKVDLGLLDRPTTDDR